MDLITKLLLEAPPVAVLGVLWWLHYKQNTKETARLHERIAQKDADLGHFGQVFEKLAIGLEVIKDRLPR